MEKGVQKLMQVQTMTSVQIAEITGKLHKHVLRDIKVILNQGVQETNFGLTYYQMELPKGGYKTMPQYILTKKGCLILASGYDAKLREKIIDRWEELEMEKRSNQFGGFYVPQTHSEALMLAAKQAKLIEQQNKVIDKLEYDNNQQKRIIAEKDEAIADMSKKVSYLDQILACSQTVTTTQIAQDYGMSAKKFNQLLKDEKIQHKVGGQWILYAPYHTMGYVHSETFIPDRSNSVKMISKWTQKGRLFLYEKLKKKSYLPLIETNRN